MYGAADSLVGKAGNTLGSFIEEQKSKNSPVLILTTGGLISSLDCIDSKELGEWMSIGVSEEKFTLDPEVNNFIRITKTNFYREAIKNGCHFMGSTPNHYEIGLSKIDGVRKFSERLEHEIRNWREMHGRGKIAVLLQLTQDGHVAGIFPSWSDKKEFKDLFEGNSWYVGYDIGSRNSFRYRATVTNTFLKREVDFCLVCAIGPSVKNSLTRLLKERGDLTDFPLGIIRDMKEVMLFTDSEILGNNKRG